MDSRSCQHRFAPLPVGGGALQREALASSFVGPTYASGWLAAAREGARKGGSHARDPHSKLLDGGIKRHPGHELAQGRRVRSQSALPGSRTGSGDAALGTTLDVFRHDNDRLAWVFSSADNGVHSAQTLALLLGLFVEDTRRESTDPLRCDRATAYGQPFRGLLAERRLTRRMPLERVGLRGRLGGWLPGERHDDGLYEVWWSEEGASGLRASFRLLGDALRYVSHRDRAGDARLRTPDGDWVPCAAYDMPRERGSEAPPDASSGQPEPEAPLPPLVAQVVESLRAEAGTIVREVIRRTGLRQADVVERVVLETLKVLAEMGRGAKERARSAPTNDEARPRAVIPDTSRSIVRASHSSASALADCR